MSDDNGKRHEEQIDVGQARCLMGTGPKMHGEHWDNIVSKELFPPFALSDVSPVAAFVINADHVITHWNWACERLLGRKASEMVGTRNQWKVVYQEPRPVMADLVVDGTISTWGEKLYPGIIRSSTLIPGAYEGEFFFPQLGQEGLWILASAAPLLDRHGEIIGAIEILQNITKSKLAEQQLQQAQSHLEQLVSQRTTQLAELNTDLEEDIQRRKMVEVELIQRNAELTELNAKLSTAQEQLMHSEKLASIGQLAAGVAHEINNPIGYIFSNFNTLTDYLERLFRMLAAYERAEPSVSDPEIADNLQGLREEVELNYLKEDIPVLMSESREGIARVRKIVQDLKDFSRVEGSQDWQWTNLHHGIDSTLNIVSNEVKYKADIVKKYNDIPDIECLPSQINQVIMNIVVNAAHAIGIMRGTITIRTATEGDNVILEIKDTGSGIAKENLSRIFDPFFTTKPIGQGTGLGLSLAYGIVQKHHGHIDIDSELGRGTTFRITLPIHHCFEKDEQGKDIFPKN